MRIAFDSRPASDPRGIGRYVRCLLAALRATAGEHELVEQHRPRGVDVFHSPWIDGARSRTRCPQVVTLHDLVPLKRPAEYLRTGLRFRLRYLAAQRAARVIVPTEAVAGDAVERLGSTASASPSSPRPPRRAMRPRGPREVAAVRERYAAARRLPALGRRPRAPRPAQARRGPRRGAARRCRSCSSGPRRHGRASCPT